MDGVNEAALLALMERTGYPMLQVGLSDSPHVQHCLITGTSPLVWGCEVSWWTCLCVLLYRLHYLENRVAEFLPNFRWNSPSPWLGLSLAASRYAVYFRFCGWRLYSQAQAAGKERVFKVANHRAARTRYGHRFAVYSVTWPGCSTGGKVCSLLYCLVIGRSCLRQFNDIEDRICIYVRGDLVLWYDMIRYKMLF